MSNQFPPFEANNNGSAGNVGAGNVGAGNVGAGNGGASHPNAPQDGPGQQQPARPFGDQQAGQPSYPQPSYPQFGSQQHPGGQPGYPQHPSQPQPGNQWQDGQPAYPQFGAQQQPSQPGQPLLPLPAQGKTSGPPIWRWILGVGIAVVLALVVAFVIRPALFPNEEGKEATSAEVSDVQVNYTGDWAPDSDNTADEAAWRNADRSCYYAVTMIDAENTREFFGDDKARSVESVLNADGSAFANANVKAKNEAPLEFTDSAGESYQLATISVTFSQADDLPDGGGFYFGGHLFGTQGIRLETSCFGHAPSRAEFQALVDHTEFIITK